MGGEVGESRESVKKANLGKPFFRSEKEANRMGRLGRNCREFGQCEKLSRVRLETMEQEKNRKK